MNTKEKTYKEKLADLDHWLYAIIEGIKKDLKNDHLKKDWLFVKKYLSSSNLNKVPLEELVEAYRQALQQEEIAEELAEFITNRWILKNSDIYNFYEKQLTHINPNFQEIELIEPKKSSEIIQESSRQFGAPHTYIFSILNSVAFPSEALDELQQQAKKEVKEKEEKQIKQEEHASIESLKQHYATQIDRLTDKYEKKLQGMQKKYTLDVEALKKQIAQLQRKLNEK